MSLDNLNLKSEDSVKELQKDVLEPTGSEIPYKSSSLEEEEEKTETSCEAKVSGQTFLCSDVSDDVQKPENLKDIKVENSPDGDRDYGLDTVSLSQKLSKEDVQFVEDRELASVAHIVVDGPISQEKPKIYNTLLENPNESNAGLFLEEIHVYNQSRSAKLRSLLLHALEELRIRRMTDNENEEKIKQCVKEKHSIQCRYEEAMGRVKVAEAEMQEKEMQVRRHYQVRLKQHEEDKSRCALAKDMLDKEVSKLKKDIKGLQLEKLHLEKCVREQGKKLTVGCMDSNNYTELMSGIEEQCRKVKQRQDEVGKFLERLAKNVETANRVNGGLEYFNKHHRCEMKTKVVEIGRLQKELQDARIKIAAEPAKLVEELSVANKDKKSLDEKLRQKEILFSDVSAQLKQEKQHSKELVDSLKANQILVERHTKSLAATRKELQNLRTDFCDLRTKHENLNVKLADTERTAATEKAEFEKKLKNVEEEKLKCEENLKVTQQDLSNLQEKYSTLEELNMKWAKENSQLRAECAGLQALLNKPKSDAEVQVSPEMADIDLQTDRYTEAASTQTEIHTEEKCVQFQYLGDNNASQTDVTHKAAKEVQVNIVKEKSHASTNTESLPEEEEAALEEQITVVPSSQPNYQDLMNISQNEADQKILPEDKDFISSSQQQYAPEPAEPEQTFSPKSRVRATIEALCSTVPVRGASLSLNKKRKAPQELKDISNTTKPKRYSFQFVNVLGESEKENSGPSSAEVKNTNSTADEQQSIVGILQDKTNAKPKKQMRVRFDPSRNISLVIQNDDQYDGQGMEHDKELAAEAEEESLFSDEEGDNMELGSQVMRIESLLSQESKED